MLEVNGVTYKLHRTGIMKVLWPRNEDGSPLHPRLRDVPHAAFKVSDLDRAIAGKTILFGPCEPIKGYRFAAIDYDGVPIELAQTALSDDELRAMVSRTECSRQMVD